MDEPDIRSSTPKVSKVRFSAIGPKLHPSNLKVSFGDCCLKFTPAFERQTRIFIALWRCIFAWPKAKFIEYNENAYARAHEGKNEENCMCGQVELYVGGSGINTDPLSPFQQKLEPIAACKSQVHRTHRKCLRARVREVAHENALSIC